MGCEGGRGRTPRVDEQRVARGAQEGKDAGAYSARIWGGASSVYWWKPTLLFCCSVSSV